MRIQQEQKQSVSLSFGMHVIAMHTFACMLVASELVLLYRQRMLFSKALRSGILRMTLMHRCGQLCATMCSFL